MSARPDDIRRSLDEAAARAAGVLRKERASRALRAALDDASAWAWLPALLLLAAVALGGTLANVCLAGAIAAFLIGGLSVIRRVAASRDVDTRDAIGRLDARLGDEDRLLTAHEFLGRAQRGGFHDAAILDAADSVRQATSLELTPEPADHIWSRRGRLGAVLAVLLLAFALIADPALVLDRSPVGKGVDVATGTADDTGTTAEDEAAPAEEFRPTERVDSEERPTASGPQEADEGASGQIPDDSRETEGATGEGRSAEASASKGAGQSKGMPSPQGQVSVPPEREAKHKKRKPSDTPEAERTEAREPEDEQPSGSTAGTGAASGSNRNPSTSEWSSKDHVSETDDEAVSDDDDVDDEDSDSDARGGAQPNLRDRRPPVNRDLSVGFGNEADEESNGRGGPGQQKKSRGTASLVLGVPIPDHVKGQPNPGRTKITQERVEPKDDEAPQVRADDHGTRSRPSGDVPRTQLAPWMRALVRSYFLELRRNATKDMP